MDPGLSGVGMYSHNLILERGQRAMIDGIAVFSASLVAVWIRHGISGFSADASIPWSTYLFPAVVVAVLTVFVLHLWGSYRAPHSVVPTRVLVAALGFATLVSLTMSFFYRAESYSRATVLIFIPVAVLTVIALRFIYRRYVEAVWRTQATVRRVLIVGRTPSGVRLAKAWAKRPAYYDMVGFVDDPNAPSRSDGSQPITLGSAADLDYLLDENGIDEVFICLPNDPDRVMDVIGQCMRQKVMWKTAPNVFGLRLDRIAVDDFDGIPLVGPHGTRLVGFNWALKRGFDIVVAGVALILLSPVFLAVAFAVRATSKGPVLFRQTRVGLNGQPFTMLKFRSMRSGSKTQTHNDYTREWIYGRSGSATNGTGNGSTQTAQVAAPPAVHKITNDPRITRVGRFLRATSLDEIPQFWNVLRGEMSVVGPRPAMQYEVDRYTEWHKRRLAVPPGITGAWQVAGRNDLSFEEMVALDVDYIERWSLELDMKIVIGTVPAVLKLGGK